MFIIVEYDTVNFNILLSEDGTPAVFSTQDEASEYASNNCIHDYRVVEF